MGSIFCVLFSLLCQSLSGESILHGIQHLALIECKSRIGRKLYDLQSHLIAGEGVSGAVGFKRLVEVEL
jgi:hypothetical protein